MSNSVACCCAGFEGSRGLNGERAGWLGYEGFAVCGFAGFCLALFALEMFALEFFEEAGGGAFVLLGDGYATDRSDRAEGWVFDDVLDGVVGDVVGPGLGEVEAGDLEAVEEQAGAAWVDLVRGDALEDVAEGELDGGAVFGVGEDEVGGLGLTALAGRKLGGRRGTAGGLVEVAEGLIAQARAAATAAVDVDVAALEAGFRVWPGAEIGLDGTCHGLPPPPGYLR